MSAPDTWWQRSVGEGIRFAGMLAMVGVPLSGSFVLGDGQPEHPAVEVLHSEFGSSGGQVGSHSYSAVTSTGQLAGAGRGAQTSTRPGYVGLLNEPPEANHDVLEDHESAPFVVAIQQLLQNDRDPEGDPLLWLGVNSPSTDGAELRVEGEVVRYTPVPGYSGLDTFTYIVADRMGNTVVGTVTVRILRPGADLRLSIEDHGAGNLRLRLVGRPGVTYRIESTTTLGFRDAAWEATIVQVADENGQVVVNVLRRGDVPALFYRGVWP